MRVVACDYVGYFLDDIPLPFAKVKWRDLQGKPYIWHGMERLKGCKKIDEVILFTQNTSWNKEVIDLAKEWGFDLRYLGRPYNWEAQLKWNNSLNADIVIYINYNSSLIDPKILDSMVEYLVKEDVDYLEPEGIPSIRISKANIWTRLSRLEEDYDKIKWGWPTLVKERRDLFKSAVFGKLEDITFLGKDPLRWHPKLRRIYKRFYRPGEIINLDEVLLLYKKEPEWFEFLPGGQLEIEVTNDCDLKCIMCPRTLKMNREIGYMDLEVFKRIIDELQGASFHFSGLGEPLLHPDILDMFTYAKGKGHEVGLWTNGLNLDEGLSKEILEKELLDYIIFSLDAATKETYDRVKGVNAFDKAIENINRFLKWKKEKFAEIKKGKFGWWYRVKPIVGIWILKMKENDAEIEGFMNNWDWMDRVRRMINYRNRSQELNKVESEWERSQGYWRLEKELWETLYTKAELPVEHAIIGHFNRYCDQIEDRSAIDVTPLKRFSCKQLQNGISVLWNGDVAFCRQDINGDYTLGNLKDQSLQEILDSERLEEIWQAHKDGRYEKLPLCGNCKEWYYNPYA